MPDIIALTFIRDGRSRPNQGHFPSEHVDKLGKLVQTGLPQESSYPRHARVVRYFVNAVSLAGTRIGRIRFFLANKLLDILLMNFGIGISTHGPKLKKGKSLAKMADPLLPEKNRALRGSLDKECNRKKKGRKRNEQQGAHYKIEEPLQKKRKTSNRAFFLKEDQDKGLNREGPILRSRHPREKRVR